MENNSGEIGYPCLTPRPITPGSESSPPYPYQRFLPDVQILEQSSIPPINMQAFHYLKHLNPIYSVKRFLKINKTDIHCISMFQTSLTQCPHHSNCISS